MLHLIVFWWTKLVNVLNQTYSFPSNSALVNSS